MENVNLTGQFLVAMPAMTDPYFAKSVTFICEHNADGAMGIVINRPIDMTLQALFKQLNLPLSSTLTDKPVYFGGPVQLDRGFVLHQPLEDWDSTLSIDANTGLTTSKDILQAVAEGHIPDQFVVSLGYAGWSAGQLEQELAQNAWLTVEATPEQRNHLLFGLPAEEKVQATMALLGLDFARFAEEAGHA